MNSKRALRRYHYQRLKNKRIRQNYWGHDKNVAQLGISVDTPKPCSCWMCGNPRKYFGEKSRQERMVIGRDKSWGTIISDDSSK